MAGSGDPAGSKKTIDLEEDIATIDQYVLSDADTVTTRETPAFPSGKVILTLAGIQQLALDGIGAKIYATVAAGEADSVNGQYFWVVSADPNTSLELWLMGATTATDTGKTILKEIPPEVLIF